MTTFEPAKPSALRRLARESATWLGLLREPTHPDEMVLQTTPSAQDGGRRIRAREGRPGETRHRGA
jgi:hypothetical protein